MSLALLASALLSCTVTDGDTLRCAPAGQANHAERVRLLGIDAPELHECPRWRQCAPGDGKASKAALARLIDGGQVRLIRHGTDRYGRTLAIAMVGGTNLSCAQVKAGRAIYKPRWDINGAARCR